jgi:hypothetical protein
MRRLMALALLALLLPAGAWAQRMPGITFMRPSVSTAGGTMTGPLLLPDGTGSAAPPAIGPASRANQGFVFNSTTQVTLWLNAGASYEFSSIHFQVGANALRLGNVDSQIIREDAAKFQFGTDAATAAQTTTLKGPDSATVNIAGGALNLQGGTGGSGGAQGNLAVNAPAVVGMKTTALTDNTKKAFVKVAVPANDYAGGDLVYTLYCADAADQVTRSGRVPFAGQAKTTVATCPATLTATSSGDISNNAKTFASVAFTCAVGGNNLIQIEVQADCSITTPTDVHIDFQPQLTKARDVFPQT